VYTAILEDEDRDKVFKEDEKMTLRIFIENGGRGTAQEVRILLSGSPPVVEAFWGDHIVGNIAGGAVKRVILSGIVPKGLIEQEMKLIVDLDEKGGHVRPQIKQFTVSTRPSPADEMKAAVRPAEIDVDILPAAISPQPDRGTDIAIVVGIERYKNVNAPAKYAERDARMVTEYFHRLLGIPDHRIKTLYNEAATWEALESILEHWLPPLIHEHSNLYFYYAGYGVPEMKGQKTSLLMSDSDLQASSTRYPLERLFDRLETLSPGGEILVLLDAGFSGKGARSVMPAGKRLSGLMMDDALRATGRVISIAAADVHQMSFDSPDMQHGLFTYHFLKGIKGSADADHDGMITLSELFLYVQSQVMRESFFLRGNQTPVMSPSLLKLGHRANRPLTKGVLMKIKDNGLDTDSLLNTPN